MKKKIIIFIIFFQASLLAQNRDSIEDAMEDGHATHIYHVNGWVSAPIIVIGGLGSVIVYYAKISNKPDITAAEIAGLNYHTFGFDSWALNQTYPANRNALVTDALITQIVLAAAPLALFTDERIGHDWGKIVTMLLEANAISLSLYAMTPLGPLFQDKYRPIVYYDNPLNGSRTTGWNRNSFYSGHTAAAAASTFFMAKVYSDYYPDANKFLLYAGASLPPLFLGYLRLKALEHFPSDILVGFGAGALCGVLIPEFHKIQNKDLSLGFYTSPTTGTGIAMQMALK